MTPFRSTTLALLAAGAATLCFHAVTAHAHGTMTTPQSRVYACAQGNIENPTDPACRAATAISGTQTFYNWMGINQANANGNHQAVVPDGKLCSGNNPTFSGLDLARSDWQATPIAADANGRFEFRFRGTAPHQTRDWVFYATRDGWDPNKPLAWSDLEEFCRLGNTPLSSDGTYHLSCPLPRRSGRHIIYNTWQRSDSTEAFYTCIDVKFDGGGTPTNKPPIAAFNVAVSGLTATLTDQSSDPDGSIAKWLWNFGDGTASALPSPIKTYAKAGAYTVQLTVTDNAGASNAISRQVTASDPTTNWRDVGALTAQNALPVGTIVTLRVFNANGSDAERIETTLAANETSITAWPLRVAQNVNARSAFARIGVLSNGTITPVASATANRIFLNSADRTQQVDIRVPETPPPGGYDYVYPNGIGKYIPGQTVVKAGDGKLYACRPFPEGQWCNVDHPAYVPGSGWAWRDAWILFQTP